MVYWYNISLLAVKRSKYHRNGGRGRCQPFGSHQCRGKTPSAYGERERPLYGVPALSHQPRSGLTRPRRSKKIRRYEEMQRYRKPNNNHVMNGWCRNILFPICQDIQIRKLSSGPGLIPHGTERKKMEARVPFIHGPFRPWVEDCWYIPTN